MKVKKAIRTIAALGTGAAMLGATAFTAFGAADLSNFPTPMFIDPATGAFNGIFVVGSTALPKDIIGLADIRGAIQAAAIMKVPIADGSTTTTVEGDTFLISASGNDLNFWEDLDDVVSVADNGDLKALAGGSIKNNKGTYDYDEYIVLPTANVTFTDDASDLSEDPAHYLVFDEDEAAWTYRMTFPTAMKSDIDASNDLDDFDNKELTIMGKAYTIVNTDFDTSSDNKLTLQLMGGAITDTLAEQETKTFTVDDKEYEVTVDYITTSKVSFTVNSEAAENLEEGDTYALADGTELGVKSIMAQNAYGEGNPDMVSFYFGAQKLQLEDNEQNKSGLPSEADSASTIYVGSQSISDAYVDIVWTNTTTELAISQIDIAFYPSSDTIYVPVGSSLSEQAASTEQGDDEWVKLHDTLGIDFSLADIGYGNTEDITIRPNGNDKMKFKFTTKSGDECSVDLIYRVDNTYLVWGNDISRNLTFQESATDDVTVNQVKDEGFFIIEKNKYSHVMRLKKVDTTTTKKEVEIQDVCSSDKETITYSGTTGSFYKDGNEFAFGVTEASDRIFITDATDDASGQAMIYTQYEARLNLSVGVDGNLSTGKIVYLIEDEDGQDESSATNDHVKLNISQTSNKITVQTVSSDSINLDSTGFQLTVDSKTGYKHSVTKWGTFVEHDTEDDQDNVVITYNEKEANPLVYVSTGATTTTSGVTGSYTLDIVKIPVTASKEADDVTDVTAENMIVIGGPCANTVAATLMGNPANCAEGFVEGKAKIKLFENGDNVAMLVAGYAVADTRRATTVIAEYEDYDLTGDEVEVSGTSLEDISVAVPVVEEEEEEEETTTTTTVPEDEE